MIYLIMSSSIIFFKFVLSSAFGKPVRGGGSKVNTDVVIYEAQVGRTSFVGSATISSAVVTDSDKLYFRFHGIDLSCGSASDLIVMKAVKNKK